MERIGRWKLEERIGQGGVADVWRARSSPDGQVAALKVLRNPERSRSHQERFLREGRLLQRLNFPGLPRCFEVGAGPPPHLALELLEGETLAERTRSEGGLHPLLVESIAIGMLRMLAHLHSRGVIHRDIKSSNIFLTDDRRVMIIDLGLAADPGDPLTTTLGDVMGTYAYMAPEQIAGAEVDHRSDLYSLGVTLYEALAGNRPFYAQDASGYLRAHREGRPPSLSERCPNAPERLVDAIMRLMARDPAARPPTATVALALLTGATATRRHLASAPLVGRGAAMGAVEGMFDAGGCVLLLGEVGSGTGRMAAWTLQTAREAGLETLTLRCQRRAPPMQPLEQLARHLSHIVDAPIGPDPREISQALADLCGEGPTLLLVEACEYLHEEAAIALRGILKSARGLRAVFTGSEAPAKLKGHTVWLRPLTAAETWRLISVMLGTQMVPAGLAEHLHRLSGGLPSVIVLGVKELVSRGALWSDSVSDEGEPAWQLDRSASLTPTTGLARLFGALLVHLPDRSHAILEVLSVVGESMPLTVVLEVAGAHPSGEDLGPLLQQAVVTRDIDQDEEWLALTRPSIGALLVTQIPEARQSELHRLVVRALRRRPRDEWRDERITWHSAMGAPPEETATALLALGEQMIQRGQYALALSVLDRAMRAPAPNTRTMVHLDVARGEAMASLGRREAALEALVAARDMARDLPDPPIRARALVLLAELQQGQGGDSRAATLAEEAIDILLHEPAGPMLPRAMLAAATAWRLAAQSDRAATLYHQCIDAGMAHGVREYAAMAHGGLGQILAEAGRLENALSHMEQEVAFLRVRTLPIRMVQTLCRMARIRLRLGQVIAAIEHLDEAEPLTRLHDLPYEAAEIRVTRATVHLELGDLEGAVNQLRQGRAALEPDAAVSLRLAYRQVQAELRLASSDPQAALAAFQAAAQEATSAGFAALGAYSQGMTGVLTADTDALTAAMEVLGSSGDRSLTARLLISGARVGGDAEVLRSAEREARASRDRFVLLRALHASGTDEARKEALLIARAIAAEVPPSLRAAFHRHPAARWAGLRRLDDG